MSIMFEMLIIPCSRGPISWSDSIEDVQFKKGHQEARAAAIEIASKAYHELEAAKKRILDLEKIIENMK